MQSFIKRSEYDRGDYLHFEKFNILVEYDQTEPYHPVAAGFIIELEPEKFLCVGTHYKFKFYPADGEHQTAEILTAQEGKFVNGVWQRRRVLNGDDRRKIALGDMISAIMIEIYTR